MKEKSRMTKEQLRTAFYVQRKLCNEERKSLFKEYLLQATKRVLDIRDLKKKITEEKAFDLAEEQYLKAVKDLMDIVYSMLNDSPYCLLFCEDLGLEDYIILQGEDMVLVNGFLHELKPYNADSINNEVIIMALSEAIFDYIECISNGKDYSDGFDDYVQISITDEQEEEDE